MSRKPKSGKRSKLGEGTFKNLQDLAEKLSGENMYADFQIVKNDGSASEWYRIAPTTTSPTEGGISGRSVYKINDLPESLRNQAGAVEGYQWTPLNSKISTGREVEPLIYKVVHKTKRLGENYKSTFEANIFSKTRIKASDIASINVKNAVERKKTNVDNSKFYERKNAKLSSLFTKIREANLAGNKAKAQKLTQEFNKVYSSRGKPDYKYEKIKL